ncbi:MAG: response regulator [Candidatus Aminicenantes bacterium]|nr:response regulator [Candidatus Aminicenantes bacterium]NIM77710.1 response regulator [Candidatus Aminicenantes bacterium]NIN17023.1 response regulator [Candidatus Aminicenantes bacterium]NIN40916.1 response regulator [Candidatus Aminicenantes bacterium]NIN83721.1 response regulator [Candidatus Aminicenantes bacterium]
MKDGKFVTFTTQQGLSDNRVRSLCEDQTGNLWVGTEDGLNWLQDGKFTVFTKGQGLSSNRIKAIHEDRERNLWIGTEGGGLNRLNPRDGKFTAFTTKEGLSDDEIRAIYEDKEGLLWIGTNGGGLNCLKDGKFTPYTTREGLSNDDTGPIYEDKEGSLWIGTEGGLNRLNPKEGKFKRVTFREGLFDDTVHQVFEDDNGYLWMSCNKGIFRVRKKEVEEFFEGNVPGIHCVSYDENDGMKSRECNGTRQPTGWKSRDGKLWFPTIKGVVMIDPNDIKTNSHLPPVKIEEIIVDNKKILPPFPGNKDKLVISPGYERFEIKYTGLSFLVVKRVRFKYKLEGFNKEWIEVGTRRTAYYNKIPSGDYTFRVLACNNDGIWNESGASIPLYIKPYFYQTWWFYLVCGLAVIFLVYGGYCWRVRRLKKREVELETLVAQRTAQLQKANEKAREEREIADAANRSKSLFLARMSHEIRTPMNSVIGFAEMLMDSGLNEEQLDYAATISRSGEALLSVIDDILDFSKIEAGKLAFDPIDFSPEEIAFDVCELVLPRIENRPIEMFCRVSDQVPAYVKQDPGRFRQVLVNLMGNAVKFTREGEIDLSIDVEEESQNRLMLHSKVRDTGIGISVDRLNTIFEVFQQEDGSTTRKFGGTGLGLTICKQIARHMGGDIQVESTPGKGSTFHFYAWVEKSGKKPEPKPVMVNLVGKRVLIVDDNRNNLDILEHILKKHGMSVEKQLGGKGVISIIQENVEKGMPIDLGILDLIMPSMSGYELAAQIRKLDPPISNIPLLALSSSVSRRSNKYREAGFDGFLTKPVQSQRLIPMIERLLASEVPKAAKVQHVQEEIAKQQQLVFDDVKHDVHILLVEDNPINRKLVSSMLTKAGYRLDTAENGKEAVEKYLSSPGKYNLIFMDIQMPEMDGIAATRMIREKGFAGIPIIAMTAQSMKGDYEKCLEAGMNDYISKPIRKKVVLEMVEKWVKQCPSPPSGEITNPK